MKYNHKIAVGLVASCVVVLIVLQHRSSHDNLHQLRYIPFLEPVVRTRTVKCVKKLDNIMCVKINVTVPSGSVDLREESIPVQELYAEEKIVYNRVAKCASTTVLEVLQNVTYMNKVRFMHSVDFYSKDLGPETEGSLAYNLHSQRAPWVYDRHMRMVNFTKFGFPMPHYINVYREPAERKRSHYYWGHYLYKTKNMSFDECVARRIANCSCSFHTLIYFCGHGENCTKTNRTSLEIAKQNVVRYYDVVGVAEDLDGFFQLLEFKFPRVFKGALEVYRETAPMNADLKRSSHEMLDSTRDFLREKLWAEYEFYEFVKQRFYDAKLKAGL